MMSIMVVAGNKDHGLLGIGMLKVDSAKLNSYIKAENNLDVIEWAII